MARKKKEIEITTCDVFELDVKLVKKENNLFLDVKLKTDLPLEAEIDLRVSRDFVGPDGTGYVWWFEDDWYDLEEENGFRVLKAQFNIKEGDLYALKNTDKRTLSVSTLSDKLEVSATTGIKHTRKLFGPWNKYLEGSMVKVEENTGYKSVNYDIEINAPYNRDMFKEKEVVEESPAQTYLDKIESLILIEDNIERSEKLEDLCVEAETLLENGETEIAKGIFKRLHKIDEECYDDLLQGCSSVSENYLIELGEIKVETFNEVFGESIIDELDLNDQEVLIGVSKQIYEMFPEDMKAIEVGFELMTKANELGALNKKDNRLYITFKELAIRH